MKSTLRRTEASLCISNWPPKKKIQTPHQVHLWQSDSSIFNFSRYFRKVLQNNEKFSAKALSLECKSNLTKKNGGVLLHVGLQLESPGKIWRNILHMLFERYIWVVKQTKHFHSSERERGRVMPRKHQPNQISSWHKSAQSWLLHTGIQLAIKNSRNSLEGAPVVWNSGDYQNSLVPPFFPTPWRLVTFLPTPFSLWTFVLDHLTPTMVHPYFHFPRSGSQPSRLVPDHPPTFSLSSLL